MRKFNIYGMSCAACSARVQKAVEALNGVSDVQVNLLTNSMTLKGELSDEQIIACVQNAGYDAKPSEDHFYKESKINEQVKSLLKRILVSVILLIPLMYFSMLHGACPAFLKRIPVRAEILNGIIQAVLAFCIMLVNRSYFINGFKGLVKFNANMDSLVSLGSFASYAFSLYELIKMVSVYKNGSDIYLSQYSYNFYFESAAMILVLITVGKTLEAYSKGKTTDALKSLVKRQPETAVLIDENNKEKIIPVCQLKSEDIIVIRAGQKVPCDAVILEGNASFDESFLTGESVPVDKNDGQEIFAAAICVNGMVTARTVKTGEDTSFSRIIELVSQASMSKAKISRIADKVSNFFVPAVVLIAGITFIAWMLLGRGFQFSLTQAVCVLVISCPCSLGLATPVSIMVAGGVGAKKGILFKNAHALEKCAGVTAVVMDKTGTVTYGKLKVTDFIAFQGIDKESILNKVYALENQSIHPVAMAVCSYCLENLAGVKNCDIKNYQEKAGYGISAQIDGEQIQIGKPENLFQNIENKNLSFASDVQRLCSQGKTAAVVSIDGRYAGVFGCQDVEKPSAESAFNELSRMNLKTVILSGDNNETVSTVGKRLGADEIYSQADPWQKVEIIKKLSENHKVLMVADGINDAPALKTAWVSMAVGSATDVAVETADIVLLNRDLKAVSYAVALSRKTLKNIKENLFWAFFYNVLCIPLAAGVWYNIYGIKLTPVLSAVAMSLSSFCVVMNALRLGRFKYKGLETEDKMKKIIKINGMMCTHCEKHVKEALQTLGVQAEVSHQTGTATVIYSCDISDESLKDAVVKAGYEVVEITGQLM